MEDVLDEWEMLNLQIELEGLSDDPSNNFVAKAHSLIMTLFSCCESVMGRRRISKQVKALSDRLDQILLERDRFNLVSGENSNRGQEFRQAPSTSIAPSSNIYGRDDVRDSLVEKLKSGGEEERVRVVSIVGIGGVGKTTLAQMAYNHPELEGCFDLKGWVSVSEPFDTSVVARAILEQFGQSSAEVRSLETLVQRIKACVDDKRFLLVLDNVWTESPDNWEDLKNCLDGGAKGSRILITTRSNAVATKMGTSLWQPLDLLSVSECSQILNGIALKGREESEELRAIGVKIAEKCKGLPLAAKSLGSMLALKSSEEEWRAVLESPLWTHEVRGETEATKVFHLLNLSYTELSPVLKRCFLCSAILPRGALMSIDDMIRIWMAHGYLNSKSAHFQQVRLKGRDYFNNLEQRSFFVKVGTSDKDDGDVESFKMHDIMHEFATYTLRNEGYSFIADSGAACDLPPTSLGKLRTFCGRTYEENKLVLLKSVRVLSLRRCRLELLPEGMGELVHLRYLDVSDNPIAELPKAVTNLYNLQTLEIVDCRSLTSLPEGIEKLGRLRHILNTGTRRLREYPRGLEKLSGLWTLSEYRGSKLGYLGNLNQLQGSLTLDLNGFDDVEEAHISNLGNKNHLKELELLFGRDERLDDAVVEALQPPPNLQILHICTAGGKWLSHWIQRRSLDNLKLLDFYGMGRCSDLPPFGALPALERLEIHGCAFKSLKPEFLGGFPRLKTLSFSSCTKWEEWEDIIIEEEDEAASHLCVMRCLEELEVHDCDNLKALPHSLLLNIKNIKLSCSSVLSLRKATGFINLQGGDEMTHLPLQNAKWFTNLLGDEMTRDEMTLQNAKWFTNLLGDEMTHLPYAKWFTNLLGGEMTHLPLQNEVKWVFPRDVKKGRNRWAEEGRSWLRFIDPY